MHRLGPRDRHAHEYAVRHSGEDVATSIWHHLAPCEDPALAPEARRADNLLRAGGQMLATAEWLRAMAADLEVQGAEAVNAAADATATAYDRAHEAALEKGRVEVEKARSFRGAED